MGRQKMENKKKVFINRIDKILNDQRLSDEQTQTMSMYDRFNELEAQNCLRTRLSHLTTLSKLGQHLKKPFEQMTREDLQNFFGDQKQVILEGTLNLMKTQMKRFFRNLAMVKHNENCPDEDKLDMKDVDVPYSVRWIKVSRTVNDIQFEDLPTEEEILKMVSCVETQRDRALLITLWETGCSPHEVLSLKIKSVVLNQYGGNIILPRYIDAKTKTPNKLKTEFRHRTVPIATSIHDLQLWISMHPQKGDLDAPLWPSRKGGSLSYQQLYKIFKKAVKKAGIKKHLTPYSLRHMRLTQVAEVLPSHELKEFAGHSKYSQVTPRYLHPNSKQIQMKIYRERGVKIEEPEKKETPLAVKMCPRCKHRNSPTYNFCAICSMPLDFKTRLLVQKKAEILHDDMIIKSRWNEWFTDDEEGSEHDKLMRTVFAWMEKNPERFREFMKIAFEHVIGDMMKNRLLTAKTT